ncbi:putative protein Networked (NET), actin-binding (NAB) [Helianthus annuus]|uniref:Putative myosin heavy chain-related protein n=1 Tax=Helianthus annuus TaxID=4232 RepID=A0A251VA41_HELAN|nr:COP1-interactive protein 1 [Helianthus annuus]KAF5815975.1 putative protein Networked (NET), actin-binding (NAB) [Helianthus annuus]KAJ0937302.1 putative protein Networked (NET), actin-binding (NAB) [Helianthus annuus]KAJ0945246.1 putative protein Networked (NET), actin-binding (NAB) [Helianthus annuus]
MGKHRLRNRIKSMVGSLIDPDKDEQLKGSNIETEENYKKILEIVKDEDQVDKSELVELIEEFHNRYNSIYERYDQITGKLQEKVRSKNEKDSSSSSSSDSDSDDASNKESKNGKLAANTEIHELQIKLAAETEEKEALNSQLQETVNMLNESKLQSDRLLEENSKLLAENRELNSKLEDAKAVETELNREIEDIKKERTSLTVERETTMKTVEELTAITDQLKAEKDGFESELQSIKGEFQKLVEQKTEFEQQKNEELLALEKNYEEKIDNLRKELESITVQKQESDNLIECLRDEITNKNGDQERLLEEKDAHVAEIKQLQKKIDEMSAEIENGIQLKEQTVEQLEETIEDLKSDLEIKGDEVNMLTETIRNLEVKIRLSTQKLRVTEQTLSETEHEHAAKEEKLHQENKSLVEKISTLTQMIADIKREVQDQVNETLTGVDSLTVKFEEDYGHVRTRVTEITNEIQAMQIQLKQMKEDAKQKLDEMVTELKLSETENDRLMKSLEDMKTGSAKKDEKINELENTIHVKDERMLSFCEDKREAIKQLCIWADYHRDRFDHLQQLLKTSISTQRQTVR